MTLKATLQRLETSDVGTFGELTITDGDLTFKCKTGELPWINNKRVISCISSGKYTCEIVNSPKFGPDTYEIKAVQGRSHVLIHAGNHCGDVACGHESDVQGCVLLGKEVIPILNGNKVMQMGVARSKQALKEFKAFTNNRPFELEIIDVPLAPDAA